jgi:hypothetical protein
MAMASMTPPSSGDQGVCAAVALGWQVAQLFHSPVGRGTVADPDLGDHLPGRSRFPDATKSKWLGEQIQAQVTVMLRPPPPAVMEAMADVLAALDDPDRNPDTTRKAIFSLHCRLLEALTIADFRAGKGYGLGRAMAETALLPASAASDTDAEQSLRYVLGNGRLITIRDWLADLKTLLPDHTAYAVSRSLDDWGQWAAKPPVADEWAAARSAIEVQGRIWRQLLTGEKAAQDILQLSDYHKAAVRVATRVITRFWWCIVGAAVLIGAVVFAGTYLHSIPPSVELIGAIAWLAGAFGITLKGTGALLGVGLKGVEGWVWRLELDGSIAIAATRLPAGARPSRVSSSSLGALRPEPKPGDAGPEQAGTGQQVPESTYANQQWSRP